MINLRKIADGVCDSILRTCGGLRVRVIDVPIEFGKYPGVKFRAHGPMSGEEFRDDFLLPALRDNDRVVLKLDGAMGYGYSFLEEAFGGAVRAGAVLNDTTLELQTEDGELQAEIWDYIQAAVPPCPHCGGTGVVATMQAGKEVISAPCGCNLGLVPGVGAGAAGGKNDK